MDVTRLTEDEQIALAIQMSMAQNDNTSKSIHGSILVILIFLSNLDVNDVEMKEVPPNSTSTEEPMSKVGQFAC